MNVGRTVVSQLIETWPQKISEVCGTLLRRARCRKLLVWDPLLSMTFVQRTYQESLTANRVCVLLVVSSTPWAFAPRSPGRLLRDAHERRLAGSMPPAQHRIAIARPLDTDDPNQHRVGSESVGSGLDDDRRFPSTSWMRTSRLRTALCLHALFCILRDPHDLIQPSF